jgi:tetratricopeptide (TPR) repeat protein
VPTTPAVSASASVQDLYQSGRYREVLNVVGAGGQDAAALFFAAHSSARLGQREDAARQFAQVAQAGANPAWQTVADLALALIDDDAAAIDRARGAASAFPDDPFVQFELGIAHVRRNDIAAAAQAFDRCSNADPRFAYAYYNGGLVYDRLNRKDLAVTRLETFLRLAPDAPERPEVASILQTFRLN